MLYVADMVGLQNQFVYLKIYLHESTILIPKRNGKKGMTVEFLSFHVKLFRGKGLQNAVFIVPKRIYDIRQYVKTHWVSLDIAALREIIRWRLSYM